MQYKLLIPKVSVITEVSFSDIWISHLKMTDTKWFCCRKYLKFSTSILQQNNFVSAILFLKKRCLKTGNWSVTDGYLCEPSLILSLNLSTVIYLNISLRKHLDQYRMQSMGEKYHLPRRKSTKRRLSAFGNHGWLVEKLFRLYCI